MYKKLVDTLRFCATNGPCYNCPIAGDCKGTFGDGLYLKAADAIETLLRLNERLTREYAEAQAERDRLQEVSNE